MELILEGEIYLERFSGKGGWTYVPLKKESFNGVESFGMLKVSGQIDGYKFDNKNLMPKGDGTLFLPVAKAIRNEIQKEAGELVYIKLFKRSIPKDVPDEVIACLKDVPGKYERFMKLSQKKQKEWVKFIYEKDSINSMTKRILRLIDEL
ncbi:YdeI/OmpD-associated family protein [Algoriphagus sediminis]|uniref:YdeI/OmpD-associated family protein n=1 Tax=Algoriphagus sediminis TaxID=3057113 RepID=A0ABT7YBK0_9BACT|nr:YdeI/OmpD-associated family protein [Algoriphagus sediminis]MDN3203899.1 YdeI/OmpD-associated family protein [Algoriphagus sediminis]